jgi:gliding motility-associated-like protein
VACIKRFSFQIYDRWGEMVFESINILDGWDGNFKERPATSGNYVYKLSVLLYDDSIYNASGSLTLVR